MRKLRTMKVAPMEIIVGRMRFNSAYGLESEADLEASLPIIKGPFSAIKYEE